MYSYILQNLFIFFANAPGFVLSVYYNMCAVKLQYEGHRAEEMRTSFVQFLESSRRSSQTNEGGDSEERQQLHGHDENAWQKTKDMGKLVIDVTSQVKPAPAGQEKLVVGMVLIWLCVVSLICFGTSFDTNTRQLIVGCVVNANLLFFYGAPLSTIFKVLKTRSSISIHIATMVTNTLNGSFWTAYGFAVKDPFIYVPNGLGALLGVIQFCLCFLFPRRQSNDVDGQPAVELEGIAAKDDTSLEEGLSPSSSHENIVLAAANGDRIRQESNGI